MPVTAKVFYRHDNVFASIAACRIVSWRPFPETARNDELRGWELPLRSCAGAVAAAGRNRATGAPQPAPSTGLLAQMRSAASAAPRDSAPPRLRLHAFTRGMRNQRN